jgi:hypothetical protein
MLLKGVGGQVSFDGDTVRIERKGVMGRLSGAEPVLLHLREIAAVQTKKASALINGFIKFIPVGTSPVPASGEAPRGATPDQNSIMFYKKDQAAFEQLRDTVVEALAHLADAEEPDIPTQIAQLAALRDQGVLTEEEFNAKKAELLDRM